MRGCRVTLQAASGALLHDEARAQRTGCVKLHSMARSHLVCAARHGRLIRKLR